MAGTSSSPIYEGDVIILYATETNGFVYSLPVSSTFSRVSIYPHKEDTNKRLVTTNVHYLAFKVLPIYGDVDNDIDSSPLIVTKENDNDSNYLHQKLVYGRKIKLLHLASHKYLSLPPVTDANIETRPAFVSDFNDTCLFKMLPTDKSRGDVIYHGDKVILESAQQKGYHVLCVENSLSQSYELKPAVASTEFCINLYSSSDINITSKVIRGGHVIRICETEKNGYICGSGSTLTDVLPEELNHDVKTKVGARKKKNTLIPRPPPVSGDSFWQMEKPDDPIDGAPFVYGEKCRLKHLLTEKYLAIKDDNEVVLVYSGREDCKYNFTLTFFGDTDAAHDKLGSLITTGDIMKFQFHSNSITRCIALNDSNWEWMTESAKKNLSGSKWINLMLTSGFVEDSYHSFKIDKVQPEVLYQLYFVESLKSVLVKYMRKLIKEDVNPVMDELFEALHKTLGNMQNSTPVAQKTYNKMLRTTQVIDLLMGYFTIKTEESLYKNVCDVLRCFCDIPSHRSRLYLASDVRLAIFYDKIGSGIGIESVLSALVKEESDIGRIIADHLTDKLTKEKLDDSAINLMSNLCFVNGSPARDLQDSFCEKFIKKDEGIFYHVKEVEDVFYCSKTESKDELILHELPKNIDEFDFFISQLQLFSSVCKGNNQKSIAIVKSWFTFSEALKILKRTSIHLKVKSAYLELIISVYLDPSIEDSGVDIDSMWHCYWWKKLETNNGPLNGANVRKNVVNDLDDSADIAQLLVIIENELKNNELCVMDQDRNSFLNQVLVALEPMVDYGYRWNIDEESKFDFENTLIFLLNGDTDIYQHHDSEEQKDYFKSKGRYKRTNENLELFKIKLKIIRLLHLFFKQYIYLSLEQFLYNFANVKNNTIKGSPHSSELLSEDITDDQISDELIQSSVNDKIKEYFSFELYRCFNFNEDSKLVSILRDLMLYEDDDLKAASASLLYDIYNKEHIMFDEAKSSHVVDDSDRTLYNDMLERGSFKKGKRELKDLIHGVTNDEICGFLEGFPTCLVVADDETEMRSRAQNVALTTGVFSALMIYVLKFCSCEDENHVDQIRLSCLFLKFNCRDNPRIQEKIFGYFTDLLKANKIHISSVASLLTEVVTNNLELAQRLNEKNVLQIYTQASSHSNSIEHLELLVLLQAIMKPFKSSIEHGPIKLYMEMIAQMFFDTHEDTYGQLMTCENEDERTRILEESDDGDIELVKLLYLTNLLAVCCEGHQRYAEDKCRQVISQRELVGILANPKVSILRKVPFAYMLHEAYLNTERESIVSLYELSKNELFWSHVTTVTQLLVSLPASIKNGDGDQVKYFLRKSFGYYMSWKDMCEINDEIDDEIKEVCLTLCYFTKGIGPVLASFCCELSLYKDQKLAMREYEKIITSRCDALKELGDAIIALLSEENEEIFFSSKDQAEFWKNLMKSIDEALPGLSEYQIETKEDYYVSEDVVTYNDDLQSENELNKLLQCFITNCEKIYNWRKGGSAEDKDLIGLLPGGASFMSLVNLFSQDIEIVLDDELIKGEQHYKAIISDKLSLPDMLKVLFNHMRRSLTSKNRAIFNETLKQTLQVLIGMVCVRLENVEELPNWDEEYARQVKPIQDALMEIDSPKRWLYHITHPDDIIAVHVMAFLTTLLLNGNENSQNKLYDIIEEDNDFFTRLHRVIKSVIISFSSSVKFVLTSSDFKQPETFERTGSFYSTTHPIIDTDGEHLPLVEIRTSKEATPVTSPPSPPSPLERQYSITVSQLGASQEDLLHRVGFVLDLVSAMCDGQNIKMQNLLRHQEHIISHYNIVGEIAVLLQTLAEVPLVANIPTIIKAIQALIEVCGGNFANQQVALDGQVIDSINVILDHQHKSTGSGITMQCKAIELLEILMEETDLQYSEILKAITKDLKKKLVVDFIEEIYENEIFKKPVTKEVEEYTDGIYRAYHILRRLCDSDMPFDKFVGIDKHEYDKRNPWKLLRDNTHSIEVNYITKDGKEILTQVYFPFDKERELTDDDKHKLQMDINRDGPEDKVRDLLEWTESVSKRDKLQTYLKEHQFLRLLLGGETIRHWILVFLTIVLNIFVIAFFKIPQFNNCQGTENVTAIEPLLILPNPVDCWTHYQFILLYLFGIPHLFFSLWMIVAFFVKQSPNLSFSIPFIHRKLYHWKYNSSRFNRMCSSKFIDFIEEPQDSQCFDLKIYDPFLIYRIIFVLCSFAGLATFGYFYCFCILYIFIYVDVFNSVIVAITGRAKQLFYVALMILALLMIYAVLSYAFLSSFFDLSSYQYCRTLWECLVTIIREGLLDTFGGNIQVNYVNQDGPDFNVYLWRSFFDLLFYIVITIIALNVITAIFVDAFSELRADTEKALQDQKDVCFICGIPNDTFEREGVKGRGFREHYKYDHNVYDYIYYVLYIRSMPTKDHNAIEKYVYEMVENNSIKFYPLRKAKVLGGAYTTRDTELIDELKKVIQKNDK